MTLKAELYSISCPEMFPGVPYDSYPSEVHCYLIPHGIYDNATVAVTIMDCVRFSDFVHYEDSDIEQTIIDAKIGDAIATHDLPPIDTHLYAYILIYEDKER